MVAIMEETVSHQKCAVVLMVGVVILVPYVCRTLYVAIYLFMIVICYTYKAVCPDGCFNGGTCAAPGTCRCSSGWTGNDCRQGKRHKCS